jgi:hypothetical protein
MEKCRYKFKSKFKKTIINFKEEDKESFIKYCQSYFDNDKYINHLDDFIYSTDYGNSWKFLSKSHEDTEMNNIKKNKLNNINKSKYQFQSRSEEKVYYFDNIEDFIEYCQIYFEDDIYKENLNAYMYSTDYGSVWKFLSKFHEDDEIKNNEKNLFFWFFSIIIILVIGLCSYFFGTLIEGFLSSNNQKTEQVEDEFVLDTSAFAEDLNTAGTNDELEINNFSNNPYYYLTDNQLNEAFKNYMSDSYFGFESYKVKGKTIRVEAGIVMNTSIRALQRENQLIFDELLKRYDKIVFWDQFGKSITITRMEE